MAFGVVALVFLAYEVVERTWLRGASPELLYALHRIRGLFSALIAAGLASWLLLRSAPPLLTEGPGPAQPIADVRLSPEEKQLNYARWFIRMRWVAVLVSGVLVFAVVEVAKLLPPDVAAPLAGLIALLALLNLLYAAWLHRGRVGAGFLAVQACADLGIFVALLHFSGGLENPLAPLMLLHVIIAGIVLDSRRCYLVAVAASTAFALLALGEWSGVLAHYTLGVYPHYRHEVELIHAAHDSLYVASDVALQTGTLLLVAFFTTTLMERVRGDERRLESFADQVIAQSQTLERALETTGTSLCVCDRQLKPFWVSRGWALWQEEAPKFCCGPAAEAVAESTLHDGRIRVEEVTIESPNSISPDSGRLGNPGARVFQLTQAPLRDKEGDISHVVSLVRDITEEKEVQARMIHANRLAAVGEIAGQVAHEVNNPIAIIGAKARLLLADDRIVLPPTARSELVKIADLSDRVARIAQGLLSYARSSPGPRALLDIHIPILEALAYLEGRARDTNVRVDAPLAEDLPLVHANAAELEQVFLNLFLNAFDAMPDGGELQLTARETVLPNDGSTSALGVVVQDTGIGITPELQGRVFEPFLTTKPEGRGSGLGLSICLGLVRSHGGMIALESEPGRGTRVSVWLPLRQERAGDA
jgi:signal transduction histidine kinase